MIKIPSFTSISLDHMILNQYDVKISHSGFQHFLQFIASKQVVVCAFMYGYSRHCILPSQVGCVYMTRSFQLSLDQHEILFPADYY